MTVSSGRDYRSFLLASLHGFPNPRAASCELLTSRAWLTLLRTDSWR